MLNYTDIQYRGFLNKLDRAILTRHGALGCVKKMYYYINQRGANPNLQSVKGNTALVLTAAYKHANCDQFVKSKYDDLTKVLIEHEADVNIRDKFGNTPLMLAAQARNPFAWRRLIEAGANINAQNQFGNTALMFVAEGTDTIYAGADDLIKAGADLNMQNKSGDTALMLAIKNGNYRLAQELAENKLIDLNIKNNDGNTALMLSIEQGNINLTKALIKNGANVAVENNNGETAFTIAKAHSKYQTLAILNQKVEER